MDRADLEYEYSQPEYHEDHCVCAGCRSAALDAETDDCEECNGSGQVSFRLPSPDGMESSLNESETIECDACKGTGYFR